jgi:hypothetical protein
MDPVGNGGSVTYQNGSVYVSEYGGGFQFDGVDDVAYTNVTTGGFGTFNTAAFTWVMICRSTQATWSTAGGIANNKYNDGTGWLINNISGSKDVTFYMGNTSISYSVVIGTITPTDITAPHMYVISSNGSNLHKGYVDNGSPISSSSVISRAAAQHEIIFGRDGYTANCLKMVSYVQIMYNRQLSDAEVLQLYSAYQSRFNFGYDADAAAFFSAAGITNTTEKTAVNQLVLDLKSYSLWTKMTAIYPFVGSTATTNKFNLKDPRDLDAAYRINFYGGWTYNSNGITGDGTSGYADTMAAMNTAAIPNRLNHWSSYNRTLPSTGKYNGILDLGVFQLFGWYGGSSGNNWFMGLQSYATTGIGSTTGFINGTVTSNSNAVLYKNGSSIFTASPQSMTTNYNYYLGALNQNGSPTNYNTTNIAFASLGGALNATDAANFYTAVQAFQTTLGRNV